MHQSKLGKQQVLKSRLLSPVSVSSDLEYFLIPPEWNKRQSQVIFQAFAQVVAKTICWFPFTHL